MVKQISRKTKSVKKILFRIKQETDCNKQPQFRCFDKTKWKRKSNFSQDHWGREGKQIMQLCCSLLSRSLRTWQTWSQISVLPSRTQTHSTSQGYIKVFGWPTARTSYRKYSLSYKILKYSLTRKVLDLNSYRGYLVSSPFSNEYLSI